MQPLYEEYWSWLRSEWQSRLGAEKPRSGTTCTDSVSPVLSEKPPKENAPLL